MSFLISSHVAGAKVESVFGVDGGGGLWGDSTEVLDVIMVLRLAILSVKNEQKDWQRESAGMLGREGVGFLWSRLLIVFHRAFGLLEDLSMASE